MADLRIYEYLSPGFLCKQANEENCRVAGDVSHKRGECKRYTCSEKILRMNR